MAENIIKAYKGFNSDLTCRDFQYEIGKEYEVDGKIELCKHGFHACISPLDVFRYYLLEDENHNHNLARFCEVELSGEICDERKNVYCDTKIASSKIKIVKELSFYEMLQLCDKWFESNVAQDGLFAKKFISSFEDFEKINDDKAPINSCKVYSCGSPCYIDFKTCENTQIVSRGNTVRITEGSGINNLIICRGKCAIVESKGMLDNIISTGDWAQISCKTDSFVVSTGKFATINGGNECTIYSEGDNASITINGDSARVISLGENANIVCCGKGSKVKAKKGSWITLTEYGFDSTLQRFKVVSVKTEFVDGERIMADTWYKLFGGEFVETF